MLYNLRAMEITYRGRKWELKGNITARDALNKIGVEIGRAHV